MLSAPTKLDGWIRRGTKQLALPWCDASGEGAGGIVGESSNSFRDPYPKKMFLGRNSMPLPSKKKNTMLPSSEALVGILLVVSRPKTCTLSYPECISCPICTSVIWTRSLQFLNFHVLQFLVVKVSSFNSGREQDEYFEASQPCDTAIQSLHNLEPLLIVYLLERHRMQETGEKDDLALSVSPDTVQGVGQEKTH